MLETVKQTIHDVPNDPFPVFFNKYVFSVQDINLESEMKYLMSHNVLDILSLDRLIVKYFNEMVI